MKINAFRYYCFSLFICVATQSLAQNPNEKAPASESSAQELLSFISENSLRGNLNFLASDLLQGRDTPSPGLDIAAQFIASQFQVAGLEAAGDEGYFQTADWNQLVPRRESEVPSSPPAAIKVVNVVGILRGSDPVLRNTYVLISAHYDHLGIQDGQIYNGANDNGSGTVSVIELAKAFAGCKAPPKRSLIFVAFFGEEKGLIGSRFYGAHPIFPIAQTVAAINLEQVGRTDDSEGSQIASAAVTGFDFSDVGTIIKQAGSATGVNIWKHPVNSDKYFAYSDNQALADQGVPAHTVSVSYEFPDYHQPGDDSDKIDYANMVKIDRTIALAVNIIANDPQPPHWNPANRKAAKYLKQWKKNIATQ